MVGGAFGVVRVIVLENDHQPGRVQPAANVGAFTGTNRGLRGFFPRAGDAA